MACYIICNTDLCSIFPVVREYTARGRAFSLQPTLIHFNARGSLQYCACLHCYQLEFLIVLLKNPKCIFKTFGLETF